MLHCEILNRLRHEKPEKYRDTKKFEFRKSPIHIVSTNDPKARSVELSPRRQTVGASPAVQETLDDAQNKRGAFISKPSINRIDPLISDSALTEESDANEAYNVSSLTRVLDDGSTVLPQVLIILALEEEQLLDFEQCRRWLQDFPALAKYARVQGVYRSNSTLLVLSIPVAIWDWLPEDPACSFVGYVHSKNLLERSSRMEDGYEGQGSPFTKLRSSVATYETYNMEHTRSPSPTPISNVVKSTKVQQPFDAPYPRRNLLLLLLSIVMVCVVLLASLAIVSLKQIQLFLN